MYYKKLEIRKQKTPEVSVVLKYFISNAKFLMVHNQHLKIKIGFRQQFNSQLIDGFRL